MTLNPSLFFSVSENQIHDLSPMLETINTMDIVRKRMTSKRITISTPKNRSESFFDLDLNEGQED